MTEMTEQEIAEFTEQMTAERLRNNSLQASIAAQMRREIGGFEISNNTQRMLSQKWATSRVQFTWADSKSMKESA
jgi:hypothetical protein